MYNTLRKWQIIFEHYSLVFLQSIAKYNLFQWKFANMTILSTRLYWYFDNTDNINCLHKLHTRHHSTLGAATRIGRCPDSSSIESGRQHPWSNCKLGLVE